MPWADGTMPTPPRHPSGERAARKEREDTRIGSRRTQSTPATIGMMLDEHITLVERAPSLQEYRRLRAAVGWVNGDVAAQQEGLRHALYSVVLECDGQVVAMGRVVGDAGNYFYVQDIIVLPQYQRQGLGRRVMQAVMAYIHSHARSGAFIALMAARGATSYYLPYGFKVRPDDAPGMWFMVENSDP